MKTQIYAAPAVKELIRFIDRLNRSRWELIWCLDIKMICKLLVSN